MFRLYRR